MEQKHGRDAMGRFAPGSSGNPGGRVKSTLSLTARLRHYLTVGLPDFTEDLPPIDQIACRWIHDAIYGSATTAWRWANGIMERLDGKVPDVVIEHSGPVQLDWGDGESWSDDSDAQVAPGADGDQVESGEIPGGSVRAPVGEDPPRCGDGDG